MKVYISYIYSFIRLSGVMFYFIEYFSAKVATLHFLLVFLGD